MRCTSYFDFNINEIYIFTDALLWNVSVTWLLIYLHLANFHKYEFIHQLFNSQNISTACPTNFLSFIVPLMGSISLKINKTTETVPSVLNDLFHYSNIIILWTKRYVQLMSTMFEFNYILYRFAFANQHLKTLIICQIKTIFT